MNDKSREEFEAWALSMFYEIEQSDSGPFARYTSEETRDAWLCWQAARRADEALLREAMEALEPFARLKSHQAPRGFSATVWPDYLRATTATIAKLRARLEGTT